MRRKQRGHTNWQLHNGHTEGDMQMDKNEQKKYFVGRKHMCPAATWKNRLMFSEQKHSFNQQTFTPTNVLPLCLFAVRALPLSWSPHLREMLLLPTFVDCGDVFWLFKLLWDTDNRCSTGININCIWHRVEINNWSPSPEEKETGKHCFRFCRL